MRFQNALAMFDLVVFAVIRRVVHQLNRQLDRIRPIDHAFDELRSTSFRLRAVAETGETECDPDPLARYAKWSLAALALGIAIVVSRLIWVW